VVAACLDAGINLFDTADMYSDGKSEEYLGKALGPRRAEAIIATKFGHDFAGEPSGGGASAHWVETAIDGSLRRLGTDYIDLYQLHKPDDGVPIEETLGALNRLVEIGKVREIGCSNFSVEQLDAAAGAASASGEAAFSSVQNQYSLLHREPEAGVLQASARLGIGFLPYYPLHSGLLTGKYTFGTEPEEGTRFASYPARSIARFGAAESFDSVDRLTKFCQEHGRSLLELAFSWLLAHEPVASVIAGATKPEQVALNVAAASWSLSAEDLAEVDALLTEVS
jgi:aryl-alcohol dehydrogenase-like predicted oxidoreductase